MLELIFPLLILVIAKMRYGIRWIRSKFTRNSLSTFYVVSWAFYGALTVQLIMLIMTGWRIFSTFAKVVCGLTMNASIISWVFLTMHMKFVDRMHF